MNKSIKSLCCFMSVWGLTTGCKMSPSIQKPDTNNVSIVKSSLDKSVSLINLIATPEKYNLRPIRVKGFLNLEFEGNAIYLHKEDQELGIDKNGLWIDLEGARIDSTDSKSCNKRYVILEGTFLMDNKGHHGGYGGAITKITRVDLLK